MTIEEYPAGIPFRVANLERRMERIEDLKPDVMADRINTLTTEFRALKRALYTAGFSLLVASIGFSFTVYTLFGRS